MCDKKNNVLFTDTECVVLSPDFKLLDERQVLLKVTRNNNMYSFDLKNVVPLGGLTCLFTKATLDESNLWHRRLGHINFKTINKLVRGNLVRGLPSKLFENNQTCVACHKGKQHKASYKTKTVFFLATKNETPKILKNFITGIENQTDHKVKTIRCDNRTEFKNRIMNEFYEIKGIRREFSVARTLQQNGVAERKNRTLIEAAMTVLADSKLPTTFWAEVVNTACYVQNRVLVIKPHNKTHYELFLGRKPALSFMRPFGYPVTILNTLDHLGTQTNGNTGTKSNIDEGQGGMKTVPGPQYNGVLDLTKENDKSGQVEATNTNSTNILNTVSSSINIVSSPFTTMDPGRERSQRNEFESMFGQDKDANGNIIYKVFTPVNAAGSSYDYLGGSIPINAATLPNADLPIDTLMPDLEDTTNLLNIGIFSGAYDDEDVGVEADFNNLETTMNLSHIPTTRIHKDRPKNQIIGDINSTTQTRRMTKISKEHAMKVTQALTDPSWIKAMQDELLQFRLQKVWRLINLPKGKHAIGTKWVYRNKKDERGIVVRNKERLVAQGYTQKEGIDYDEVFAPVRIEAIRLFFAYASFMGFIVYHTVMKSAFLYGTIEEEVYVCQPLGFEDPQFLDKVYKVEKVLYGLHQAPRAWYETLSTYLLENRFRRGTIDKTLFIKKDKGDILLMQMSSMGELTFFLGLQVMQRDDGIFISQDKYVADILKKFDFVTVKIASTPIKTNKALLKDEEAEDVDVYLYRLMIESLMYLTASRPDIMFAVCACARFQVTPKVLHLHAVKRIFRYLKGQPKLGLWYPRDSPFNLEAFSDSDYARASLDRKSTTGAEYVAAANCCGQVLRIQNQMLDYGFNFMNTKIYIDNESTICIVKNPVFYSKTKHIEIRHHFIRDTYEKRLIQIIKIHTYQNVTDLLTKAFDNSRFQYLTATTNDEIQVSIVGLPYYVERATTTAAILDVAHASGGSPRYQEATGGSIAQTRSKRVPTQPYDLPLLRGHTLGSDEGRMQQNELMDLVTKLSDRCEALETDLRQTKKVYGDAFTRLIKKVKKLEKTVKTSQARRRSRVVISDDEEELEDPSKQGRSMIEEIDQDTGITLVQINAEDQVTPTKVSAQGEAHTQQDQPEDHLRVLSAAKVLADAARKRREVVNVQSYTRRRRAVSTGSGEISTAEESVSTAGASMPVSTAGMVQEASTPSSVATKDKGKAIMQESESPKKMKQREQIQISRDEEVALKLQEEFDAAERQRIARVHEEASSFNIEEWEDIQATIEADEELAQRIQAEEREKYSEAEKARLLAELINQRKKYFAQQRAKERRNKPLTQAQQRTYMSNYIKHMGSHTLFSTTEPTDDKEKELWVDLKRLFKPDSDDTLWKLQRWFNSEKLVDLDDNHKFRGGLLGFKPITLSTAKGRVYTAKLS
ncbi:putative ribonuclease H-like domain-containing protein [Tanacetum coccineum]